MSTSTGDNTHPYYQQGTELYFAKQYDEAIVALSKAITLNLQHHKAYDRRGSAYKSLGQYDKALHDYNRALEIDPTFHNAYRNRAHVYRHNNFPIAAIADFECAKKYSGKMNDEFIDRLIRELKDSLT